MVLVELTEPAAPGAIGWRLLGHLPGLVGRGRFLSDLSLPSRRDYITLCDLGLVTVVDADTPRPTRVVLTPLGEQQLELSNLVSGVERAMEGLDE